jgi:NAD(P)-dependent dehydrogenase (short-subunit alcohol dehydrogenase family)
MNSRIALVTGASRGLGFASAVALAARGWHIIALARTVGALEELDDALTARGGTATLVPLDITDADGLNRLAASIHQRWGGLDLLVHCAIHAAPLSPSSQVSDKDFDKSWQVNARASLTLISVTEELLRARPDSAAIFIEDPRCGTAFSSAYGGTKSAQIAIARAWEKECLRLGPSVGFFQPDPMPTATRARFHPGENRDALASCDSQAARLLALLDAMPRTRHSDRAATQ